MRRVFHEGTFASLSNMELDLGGIEAEITVSPAGVAAKLLTKKYEEELEDWNNTIIWTADDLNDFDYSIVRGLSAKERELFFQGFVSNMSDYVDTKSLFCDILNEFFRPCGLNADWYCAAWHLGPSDKPNVEDGDFYITDDEGTDEFFLVQYFPNNEDQEDQYSEIAADSNPFNLLLSYKRLT